MRLMPLASILLASAFIFGCSSGAGNTASNPSTNGGDAANSTNTAKDSVDDLSMMIRLPFEPEEATWREPQPGENKLTAVLLYSNEDTAKFSSHLAAQGQPKAGEIAVEDWFPSELRSQSDIGGESTLKGQTYPAGDIVQPPYTAGTVTRVDDSNYFVVQLTTK